MINLELVRSKYTKARTNCKKRVTICAGTGCVANGSLKLFELLQNSLVRHGQDVAVELDYEDPSPHDVQLSGSGCQGFCQVGPLVTIEPEGILYTRVKAEDVEDIVTQTVIKGGLVQRLLYVNPTDGHPCLGTKDIPFYAKQHRTVLKECGMLDCEDIVEYIGNGGYFAAQEALSSYSPEELCRLYQESGLRGRGGGGFPTGWKWESARRQPCSKKYVICNGDEGDPGAFMDRSILEGNPHAVLEGMIIAAKASGADEGYVYVRMEYPLACKRIKKAIEEAEKWGILGNNLFGTNHSFIVKVMEGAGAFVCGEETALVASIEGKRGMPKPKPPYTSECGLFGKPTVVNNVETLALVPVIMRIGAEAYRKTGTDKSPGTKSFALTGHVVNTGLIEVPFGTTLRQIIFEIGGGVIDNDGRIDNDSFKAVQIGGPSGGCLTEEHLDVPLDFDSLGSLGAMVGSGGLVVMNKTTCMVSIAKYFMSFTQHESCGKCVPCREGTRQMLELLEDICNGDGTPETLELLEELGNTVKTTSLCGLGKSAPNPILSTLRFFRNEYDAHVTAKFCPTKNCKSLTQIFISEDLCRGCTLCKRVCPVGAIKGEVKQLHAIDPYLCIKCGACVTACKFKAIS